MHVRKIVSYRIQLQRWKSALLFLELCTYSYPLAKRLGMVQVIELKWSTESAT